MRRQDPADRLENIAARFVSAQAEWAASMREATRQRIAAEDAMMRWRRVAEAQVPSNAIIGELADAQARCSVLESRLQVAMKERAAEMAWRKRLQKRIRGS